MALITHFEPLDGERYSIHRTQVKCKYKVIELDGKKVVQLNTYGSKDREIPDKLSQTIQLSEKSALELLTILQKAFL